MEKTAHPEAGSTSVTPPDTTVLSEDTDIKISASAALSENVMAYSIVCPTDNTFLQSAMDAKADKTTALLFALNKEDLLRATQFPLSKNLPANIAENRIPVGNMGLIGDQNNLIPAYSIKEMDQLYNKMASGEIPSGGSKPDNPQLLENVRKQAVNFCMSGS